MDLARDRDAFRPRAAHVHLVAEERDRVAEALRRVRVVLDQEHAPRARRDLGRGVAGRGGRCGGHGEMEREHRAAAGASPRCAATVPPCSPRRGPSRASPGRGRRGSVERAVGLRERLEDAGETAGMPMPVSATVIVANSVPAEPDLGRARRSG